MNNYSWSYSAFSSALKCLKHFQLRYLKQVDPGTPESGDLVFGSALHSAINSSICGTEDATLVFDTYWEPYKGKDIEYGRFNWEQLRELGLNFVSKFERMHAKHYKVESAEKRMYGVYEDMKIEGTADFIGEYKGLKSVRDFKTSGYNYDKDKSKIALQLYLYTYLAIENLGFKPQTLGYTVFNKGVGSIQDITWEFKEEDMRKALEQMTQYTEIIKLGRQFTENKYVLSRKEYEAILPTVEKNLEKFSYLDDGHPPEYTTVKSTYMDSYDLVMFKKHIADEDNRSKVRIREYAPNGVPGNEHYIEIKEKKQGNDSKSRIRLDNNNLALVKQGKKIILDEKLKKMNEKMREFDLRAIMGRLNTLVSGYSMKPSISVTYTREAYQKGNIRITFDKDIKFRRLGFNDKGEAQRIKDRVNWDRAKELADRCEPEHIVMEVKHIKSGAGEPVWLTKMLKDNNLESHGFSKYVRACVNSIKFLLASGGGE